jgi:flagellar FliJ protein
VSPWSPFHFRLERVRALRERSEDLAKEEFAASLTLRMRGEALLRSVCEELEGAHATERALVTGDGMDGATLASLQAYRERVERRREAAAIDLERAEEELAARRDALVSASRERQVLERLKDRRRADHERERNRLEGVVLDEIATNRHNRRMGAR